MNKIQVVNSYCGFSLLCGTMFFNASKLLAFLTSPIVWVVTAFLLSLVFKNSKKKKRFFIVGLSMLLVFTNPFLINFILRQWEIPAVKVEDIKQSYEVGIMLSGTVRYYNNDVKRPVYGQAVDRFFNVIDLYKEKKIKKIFLGGGSGSIIFKDFPEAEYLRSELLKFGIDSADIITESASRNTYENAKYGTAILKEKNLTRNVLLITSAFHMRRSLKCFEKAGIHADPFSVDQRSGKFIFTADKTIIPNPECLLDWEMLIHEWIGFVAYKISGYI